MVAKKKAIKEKYFLMDFLATIKKIGWISG